jgi:hypothetical protein
MSDMNNPEDFEIRITAVLDEFAAAQRAQGIDAARKQRIMFVRSYEGAQISFEGIVDEGADTEEIYAMLDRIDQASNRMKAKSDLSDAYNRLLNLCGQLEMSQKRLATNTVAYDAENQNRRVPKLTDAQKKNLEQDRNQISDSRERIEECKKAIIECRRILDGEDPFGVLAEQIEKRLAEFRGLRAAA